VNPKHNKPSTNVHQERHFPFDLNYPLPFSSGPNKMWDFDLNQFPPAEDE